MIIVPTNRKDEAKDLFMNKTKDAFMNEAKDEYI
jgi:hypothetical protein